MGLEQGVSEQDKQSLVDHQREGAGVHSGKVPEALVLAVALLDGGGAELGRLHQRQELFRVDTLALADPRGWAMEVLGFDLDAATPSKRDVTRQYRRRMRDVHPDHGGDSVDAAKAMSDLAEARRVLSSAPE